MVVQVRVALTQRRVRMHDASLFVTNTSSDFSLLGPGGLFSGTSAGSNTTGEWYLRIFVLYLKCICSYHCSCAFIAHYFPAPS